MLFVVWFVILSIAATVHPSPDFLGTATCPEDVCHFERGHFRIVTSPMSPEGRDFRTFHITKDYSTRFEITFIIKNVKNFDPDLTRLNVGGQSLASNKYYYASVTSSKDKILHFRDVTNARIALLSFQENAALDVYYFMDCGFKMDQFAKVEYPESSPLVTPTLKMWNSLPATNIEPIPNERRTCWFVIPRDNYKGWANIDKTYIVVGNATLSEKARIEVANVANGKHVLSYPELFHTDGPVVVDGQPLSKAIDIGTSDFPVTTALFVDLVCSSQRDVGCKYHSKFSIAFKPITKEESECIKIEEYCQLGASQPNYLCKPENRLPAITQEIYGTEGFASTHCTGVQSLLQKITLAMVSKLSPNIDEMDSTQEIPGSPSERRMGMTGKCNHYSLGCPSIRSCSSAGSCKFVCFWVYIRKGCRRKWSYSYSKYRYG